MPSCTVCGEDEFEARDGLFFCTMCMTQSQDLRQEEAAEEFIDVSNAFGMHMIRNKKQQHKTDKQDQRDKGRSWSCYEGFQIIIKEQVKALIRLGADPKLKDVVFRLWCTYLAKINVAFTENLEKNDPLLKKFERHREKYPGTENDPDIKPVVLCRTMKKKSGVAAAKANIESQELQFSLREEEFYDDDNPFQRGQGKPTSGDELDVDSDDNSDIEEDGQSSTHLTRRSYIRHPGFMSMKKTLAFCHLGLMYTNPLTTAVDIVRWVHENEIPYEKASNLLPKDMKFGPYDSNTFRANLPVSEEKLRQNSGQMINYLDLLDIPMPPITDLINKYLVILELPGDLHGFVHKIQELTAYVKHYKRIGLPSYDSIAMAFIITTLEILIGLDGSIERKLSKISKKMESLIPVVQLFVWDDWVCHINKKQKLTLTHLMSKTFDMRVLENVQQVTTSVRHAQRRVGRHTEKQLSKKFQESSQNALLLPLKMLSEREESAVSSNDSTLCGQEEDNTDNVGSASQETTNQVPEIRSQDNQSYRTCRLKHITQPKHFANLINQEWRLSQETHGSCQDTGENTDGFHTREETATNRTGKGLTTTDNIENTAVTCENPVVDDSREDSAMYDTSEHIQVSDQELYDSLTDKIEQIFTERQLDKNFGKKCMLTSNSSYRWLVHKCAVLTETSDTNLNRHVNEIQTALIKSFSPQKKGYMYFNEGFVAFLYNLIRKSKLFSE
ncbi:TATA box-binding protein-associated factor RNA polymerase I subunit B-like [Mizuhopecten yessoensis]|uniref:TATA box-binding protein-associated factor RNA polymerase I subunit B n=1 Tax=Mizuhopecten yessoensis TaxID=6573 RepID=A0A210PPD1_MIZYE|nr:TATA box-binding protein-associated factor RNA polymerase I subunit B-like [Mizuhopecten yessoensis]OWF38332.1 TATA box-binding protein-associated factor RNA polymerase I subunit B [Mizuhopecten yessoensis]